MSLADILILVLAAAAVVLLIIVKVKSFTKKRGGESGCDGCGGCCTRNCTQCVEKDFKKDGTKQNDDRLS